MISWNKHHGTKQFYHQICVLSALLDHDGILLKVLFENFKGVGVELGNVSYALEQERVGVFACTSYQLCELTLSSHHISISLVCCEVNCKGNELFANGLLGAMDN